jgi:Na+-transporting NADH:ubiquinone oxidoreductase subunit NqrF
MPGPEVAVKARAPFQAAPITMPIEASSSSAWTMANLFSFVSGSTRSFLQWLVKASATEEDGVIGYHAQTVAPPYTAPSAAALLPSMKMRLPTLSAFFTRNPIGHCRLSSA